MVTSASCLQGDLMLLLTVTMLVAMVAVVAMSVPRMNAKLHAGRMRDECEQRQGKRAVYEQVVWQ